MDYFSSLLFIKILTFIVITLSVIFTKHIINIGKENYYKLMGDYSYSLNELFIFMEPETIFKVQMICLSIFFLIGFTLSYFFNNIIYVVSIPFIGFFIPKILIIYLHKKRQDKFEFLFPDALDMMSNALKSGANFEQVLYIVANDASAPINQEFALVLSEHKINIPIQQALLNLNNRIKLDDVKLLVSSINTVLELGLSLKAIFVSVASLIRERSKIERKIKMLTAQVRFQGLVISLVPFVFALIMYFVDPETINYFFSTDKGNITLCAIVIMQITGFLFIRKIMNIEV